MSYGQLDTNSTPYPLRIWGNLSLKKGGGGRSRQKRPRRKRKLLLCKWYFIPFIIMLNGGRYYGT